MATTFIVGTQSLTTTDSPAVDTRGATLLVAYVSHTSSVALAPTDSKGNTWVGLTQYDSGPSSKIFYCLNPVTDAAHIFNAGVSMLTLFAAFTTSGPPTFDTGSDQGLHMVTTPQSITAFSPSVTGDLVITTACMQTGATGPFSEAPATNQATSDILLVKGFETTFGGAGAYASIWWGDYKLTASLTITWSAFIQYCTVATAAFKGTPPPPDLTALSVHFPRTSRPRPFVPGLIR